MRQEVEDEKTYSNKLVIDSLSAMRNDITDLRTEHGEKYSELVNAVVRLIKAEEKQVYLARAFEALVRQNEKNDLKHEMLESRVDILEKDAPMQKRVTNWMLTLILGIAAGAIYAGLKLIGVV
jgi:ABC-type enterochelin transport system ATPase subunit